MYLSALIIGLGSSLHCVGMCGAIALALPGATRTGWRYVLGRVQYNLGRVLVYATLGAVAGSIGYTTRVAGGQQVVSLILGVAMLLLWGLSHLGWLPTDLSASTWITRILGRALTAYRNMPLLVIGMLNGLLPCGMVYIALAGAAVSNSPTDGALFMAVFGLGTLPLMLTVSLSGRWLLPLVRRFARPLSNALILTFAVLLIVRGMNLGIPYLSPEISKTAVECH